MVQKTIIFISAIFLNLKNLCELGGVERLCELKNIHQVLKEILAHFAFK